ncbi:MAG: hypothetical protein HZA01_15805 [Nitrospinae bacterium]|nr:hypothetical protein [Nitrospinota bacterium]
MTPSADPGSVLVFHRTGSAKERLKAAAYLFENGDYKDSVNRPYDTVNKI